VWWLARGVRKIGDEKQEREEERQRRGIGRQRTGKEAENGKRGRKWEKR
jgi:hypothetical protein